MFDTVNFWIDRVDMSGGNPFDILPCLSDITEHQNENGYSCTGKAGDYTVNVFENGISLKGSLAKYFLPSNIHTLTRSAVKLAIEQLSDNLHTDINAAKVTRLDVSTVIPTKYPPADYYRYLGNKTYFERLQSTHDTLYYTNHQRKIIFYDKVKEASSKGIEIPEAFTELLRYELRYTKCINKQLNADVTAAKLHEREFYDKVIKNWYNEFQSIQKLKNQSFMIDNIKSPKELKEAVFAYLLQKEGQGFIDEILNDAKAKNIFQDRKYYSRVKSELNTMLAASTNSEKNEMVNELETYISNVAKHSR